MNIKDCRQNILNNGMPYINKIKEFFENTHHLMPAENHAPHNLDPEYIRFIMGPIVNEPEKWKDKIALDFGCGCGRNIKNLLDAADFKRVDGCDISRQNAEYSKNYVNKFYAEDKCKTWENDGFTLEPAPDNEYDLVMSHIVFQHISSYAIRFSILHDIYSVLKPGGMINVHFMDLEESVLYKEDYPFSQKDFKILNCRVENKNNLIEDFKDIGFKDIYCYVGIDPYALKTSYYIRGIK